MHNLINIVSYKNKEMPPKKNAGGGGNKKLNAE